MDFKHIDIAAADLKFTDGRKFSGYASVFGGVDAYGDSIVKGAYAKTIGERERPIRMRWNHFGPVIGKWVELKEDDTGLHVQGELTPGHSVAENVYASMKHGAVDGMSIGYRVRDAEEKDGITYLKDIELVEISVVEEPADLGARVGDVKRFMDALDDAESFKEIEALLRESAGLSRDAATKLVSRIRSIRPGEQDGKGSLGEQGGLLREWSQLIERLSIPV